LGHQESFPAIMYSGQIGNSLVLQMVLDVVVLGVVNELLCGKLTRAGRHMMQAVEWQLGDRGYVMWLLLCRYRSLIYCVLTCWWFYWLVMVCVTQLGISQGGCQQVGCVTSGPVLLLGCCGLVHGCNGGGFGCGHQADCIWSCCMGGWCQ